MKRQRRLVMALALLFAAGCGGGGGPPPPATHPVTGRILVKGGGPMKEGLVVFRSAAEPLLIIRGELKPDGSFTLVTTRDGKQFPGAVAGSHEVTVHPPQGEDQSGQPIMLPQKYTVKAEANHFEIVVELPPKKR